MAENRIKELYEKEGQSAWQDDISRDMLNKGEIRKAIEETGIRGLTSNPTIFEKAIAGGTAYDEEIAGLLERDLDASAIFETVARSHGRSPEPGVEVDPLDELHGEKRHAIVPEAQAMLTWRSCYADRTWTGLHLGPHRLGRWPEELSTR